MGFRESYNFARIHDLLMRFDVETLLRLCYKPEFKKLRGQLSEDADKRDTIVRKIIEFADTNLLIDLLLRWAKETNSRLYELLGPYRQGVPTLRKKPANNVGGTSSIETTATVSSAVETSSEFEYDVFICHATEDKEDFVNPLAEMLLAVGVRVWYDKFILEWGDSLSQSIDKGLARSRYGIVVLSESFFHKDWTQYELEGLWSREIGGHKVILPIWHKITKDKIKSFAPTLANKIALDTSKCNLDEIVREVVKMVELDS